MADPRVITLGCRLNTFESAVMRTNAEAAGLSDTVIVNTCAVTAEAVRQARQTIRRARREQPGARIIVTGCAAQLRPDTFAAMPEVDRVMGNAEKMDPRQLGDGDGERIAVSDIMQVRETAAHLIDSPLLDDFGSRTRAFVQVQQGCDHRCTFCIIPFARGPNRSVPEARIVEQVRRLVGNGYIEVVLTGVDVSSYGRDLPGQPTLGDMAQRLLADVPDLKRLRLTSLDPAVTDEALFRLLAEEPRFMPHLHLSLQAADDMVLKRMKRRHTRRDVVELCRRARAARADVVFGADLIAGFPTETDAMFANTVAAVEEMDLTYLHVFPYSSRAGTPAAKMPQIPKALRTERAATLRSMGDAARNRFFESRIGARAEVLVEKERLGHCQHFAPVHLGFDARPGTIVGARIEKRTNDRLVGSRAA
jgi:threonylcarbamoyladenosine tRNA methylthiotransferase MtaB